MFPVQRAFRGLRQNLTCPPLEQASIRALKEYPSSLIPSASIRSRKPSASRHLKAHDDHTEPKDGHAVSRKRGNQHSCRSIVWACHSDGARCTLSTSSRFAHKPPHRAGAAAEENNTLKGGGYGAMGSASNIRPPYARTRTSIHGRRSRARVKLLTVQTWRLSSSRSCRCSCSGGYRPRLACPGASKRCATGRGGRASWPC